MEDMSQSRIPVSPRFSPKRGFLEIGEYSPFFPGFFYRRNRKTGNPICDLFGRA
jgi:hypothetical protein